jgi:hypothetical protein
VVAHADGSFEEVSAQSRAVRSGDDLLVLPRIDTKSRQILKDMTQILYQIAVSASGAGALIAKVFLLGFAGGFAL